MQIVRWLNSFSALATLAVLLSVPVSAASTVEALVEAPTKASVRASAKSPVAESPKVVLRNKTAARRGELIEPTVDCDGDGIDGESRIDFDGDGVSDECVQGAGDIPEPPFEQSYTPTSEAFYSRLPAVGWSTQYQCGDDLYKVTLSRPASDQLAYSAQGLTLTSDITYDDLDPNLNTPLIIREPENGIRYSFTQMQGNEFYEYAITNYGGDVGLYIYQTGEQILAAPCVAADLQSIADN